MISYAGTVWVYIILTKQEVSSRARRECFATPPYYAVCHEHCV